MADRLLFHLTQRHQAPAPFVAAWLQDKEGAAPLEWVVQRGLTRAAHQVEPAGADASVLRVRVTTKSGFLSMLGPALKLAFVPRARRLAKRCAREWRADKDVPNSHSPPPGR